LPLPPATISVSSTISFAARDQTPASERSNSLKASRCRPYQSVYDVVWLSPPA